ncbi:hypothetical protein MICROWOLF_44 [Mycobacterium phage Microwolf]|uniref:Uncharacterized protein n=12 Tax=Microwolfvirus TaxID=2942894 RepID=A0A142K6C4_9CAUD|nr:hypothetical protein M611_gp52 [Mycobacterium phage Jobu08]YP_009195142.1 hypothetical protein AVT20_gp55 [Mycobacterium phage Tiffany]YP_009198469.1 hypothetical protein AVV34_gp56 [Mycobacterium phage MarQuardt]YP_009635634.1 hypothetical protein FGG58_gp51 [Mycobacterium phage JHC117]YP_009635719.1 hypothetical protein FGG61_gp51 [Mycobacterium phage Microwolf]YP_010060085.1 hypothetical protein KIJ58_gp56 [Mycobacterium phage SoilDragon]YP_010060174.1 hypothetical protein KIJ59_gp47 [M
MEDREFFDLLYQQWSKTTGAKDMFWMSEEYKDGTGRWKVYAVHVGTDHQETRKLIASELHSEADADFIAAVHGCLADLTRRLNSALDEADRADYDRDSRECRIAELELENAELRAKLEVDG